MNEYAVLEMTDRATIRQLLDRAYSSGNRLFMLRDRYGEFLGYVDVITPEDYILLEANKGALDTC